MTVVNTDLPVKTLNDGRYRSVDLRGGLSANDDPAIFFAPHADDDVISFGYDMCNHVIQGRKVLCVLMSQGASNVSLGILNGDQADRDSLGAFHNPRNEYPLSDLENGRLSAMTLGRSRWFEFASSVTTMGRYFNGNITPVTIGMPEKYFVEDARHWINTFRGLFNGKCDLKTYSQSDPQLEHRNAGLALRQMEEAGELDTRSPRFYVITSQKQAAIDAGYELHPVQPLGDARIATQRAAQAYIGWNPRLSAYGFGHRSAASLIDPAVAGTIEQNMHY